MDAERLMDEVNKKAEARKEYQRNKLRANYQYAKAKGFNSGQASVLSFKSKEVIDKLAKELWG
ncbi:hypothetical protein LCGC14_2834430 [marine sediment metagenome]|uniref:Uncharacterized protein n=1 Tax=marine sediment metagenome TaxID=412755 RepID=A0A0F8YZP3_9ZZZZ